MYRVILIKANTIDGAASEILGILAYTSQHERNIYFDGWRALGGFTTLRVIAQRLKLPAAREMMFDKVLHVDCSLWQNMRALQKAIAEELELPRSVMAIFNQQEEEDDFSGIDQSSRGVILDVTRVIFKKLINNTFLVIFLNGSNHYIDLYECGVPITSFLSNKVLWTWGSRLLLNQKMQDCKQEISKANIIIGSFQWRDHVLHEEAAEAAKYVGILDPGTIVKCFRYAWERRRASGINLGMHASNYWVCDGIIQGQGNTSAWEVGDALARNIHFDWIMENLSIEEQIDASFSSPNDHWVSTTHQALHQIGGLPPWVTSFFLQPDTLHGSRVRLRVRLPAIMFPDNNRLRVLHLSWCTFSFTSPPFLCCSHLRFLLLDHCTDVRNKEHESNNQDSSCFQKLWVLDLRYTDWSSKKMMCLMNELRELNVERVKDWTSIADLCNSKTSLVKVQVAADPGSLTEVIMHRQVPNLSNAIHLKTIILDNCVGLEQVVPDALPQSLESFSFIINNAPLMAEISRISFRGLAKLKSVLLRGLMGSLEELDLSGTAVKTLDLRELVARNLKRLILLGCEELRAIQWPPREKMTTKLEVLRIETIGSSSSSQTNWQEKANETSAATGSSSIVAVADTKLATSIDKYISIRDARLFRSLVPIKQYFDSLDGHMEMGSSPASSFVGGGGECAHGITQPGDYLYSRDIIFQDQMQAIAASEGAIKWMWTCPPVPTVDNMGWYIRILDKEEMKSGLLQQQLGSIQGTTLVVPDICDYADLLHVHDSLTITSILSRGLSMWIWLEQCRIERCPKLSFVFGTLSKRDDAGVDDADGVNCFPWLRTFWASQLPMVRYIWNWGTICLPNKDSFQYLELLHLDDCPRLIHVLPLSVHMTTLPCLQTLEIVCCGDLIEIFPLDPERQEKQTIINFRRLQRIDLHNLPRLKHICSSKMFASWLETIKIRDCWSLRRLPLVNTWSKPKVNCEKDWWNSLEWDEGDENHHPSLYKPSHSSYYKKTQLPRSTVLR